MGRLMKTRFGLVWLGFPLGLVSLVGVMLMIGFFLVMSRILWFRYDFDQLVRCKTGPFV
jgi:hypothetical protein